MNGRYQLLSIATALKGKKCLGNGRPCLESELAQTHGPGKTKRSSPLFLRRTADLVL